VDDALANWLALREEHDWAARDTSLVDVLTPALPSVPVLRIVDLGTGTGSNLRYLLPRLPGAQDWLLVDASPGMLGRIRERTSAWAAGRGLRVEPDDGGFSVSGDGVDCRVRLLQRDLGVSLDGGLFQDRHLVTASALLDLVSDQWLQCLAGQCRGAGAAGLFALTYNGETTFDPADDGDDLARDLLNQHQLRDKGLGGPAAGPGAHARARHWFADAGFEVREATANWQADATAKAFQRELIDGLAIASVEQRPDLADAIDRWRSRRLAHLDAGRSRVVVGHHDLVACPRAR
jgi:hypothetical protein